MEAVYVGIEPSISGGSSVTSPTSGVAIASVTPPEAGDYRVTFGWLLTGTTETAANNIKVKAKGVNLATGFPSTTGTPIQITLDRVSHDGTNPIAVAVTSAGTVGAIYSAYVSAVRIV